MSAGRPDPTTLFYRNSRALFLVVGLVVVSGLTSFAVLPRMEDPVIGQRAALVSTRLPGADAERVEVLVTERLEDAATEFELSHPTISGTITRLVDLLGRMGICRQRQLGQARPELSHSVTSPSARSLSIASSSRSAAPR